MKRSRALIVLVFVCLAVQLVIVGPASGQESEVGPLSSGEVVLVANSVVDLKWDPSAYPGSGYLVRWELRRGLSQTAMAVIASGTGTLTGFHRDTGLALGTTYHYRLDVVRCPGQCPPDAERTYAYFSDSVNTGFFQGTLYQSLELVPQVYEVSGGGGVGTSGSVTVVEGATLTIGGGATTIQYTGGVGVGGIHVEGGRLQVDGATFNNIAITFGDYYDTSVKGEGWVRDAEFVSGSISLYGKSVATVQRSRGDFGVYLDHEATGMVDGNEFIGHVEARRQSTLTFQANTLEGDVTVSGYGAPPDGDKASAVISSNMISNTVTARGVSVMYGAQATVVDNEILWNGFHGTEGSVVLDVSDEGSELVAERNKIAGKIAAYWGAEIELRHNVLDGSGSAITIGCIVCGTSTQATGVIERNTIQNAWGLELWPGSAELEIRHNCVRGNDPGLTWMPAQSEALDVRWNWWNHATGPYHRTLNPGGNGDEIDIVAAGGTLEFDPWDPDDSYCADVPPPPAPIDVTGRVYVPGSIYSLSRVPVTLLRRGRVLAQTVTDIDGFYSLNRVPITDSVIISVTLEYAATTPPVFRVLHEQLAGPAAFVTTRPFNIVAGGDLAMNIRFANVPELDPASGIPADRRDDVGMVYYHTHEAFRLVDEVVSQPLDFVLPVDVVAFSVLPPPDDGTYWSPTTPAGVLNPYINLEDAQLESRDRPDNREWHEFGHHVMADTFANRMPRSPGDVNHGGAAGNSYVNPSTTDAWVEGFAEAYSTWVAEYIALDPWPELYTWSGNRVPDNLEVNWKPWSDEEYAVASILRDLVDPQDADDLTVMEGTPYADCVDISIEEFWTIVETEWGDAVSRPAWAVNPPEFLYLGDVKMLYDVLEINGIGSDHSLGTELSDLQMLFVAHGAFADLALPAPGNRVYDAGEEIGRVADPARPARRDKFPIPGSVIVFQASDQSGSPVEVNAISGEVRFEPPFDVYDYPFHALVDDSGRLTFYGQDRGYEAKTYIMAWGEGHVSAQPLVVSNSSYWESMDEGPEDHFLEHTFEMRETFEVYLPLAMRGTWGQAATVAEPADRLVQPPRRTPRPCVPGGPTPTPTWTPTASPSPPPVVESIEPDSAVEGTAVEVMIYGYFFEAGATPYIAFTQLTDVDYLGPELEPPHRWRLSATLPAGLAPGVYDVTVVNPDGRAGVLTDGFTITEGPTPTPTPSATPTSTATPEGWVTIMAEDFEGEFPGAWEFYPSDGDYHWMARSCRSYEGNYSGWPVGGGDVGSALSCGDSYPEDVETWLIYGPFSLTEATAAELSFRLWTRMEEFWDEVFWGASTDGTQFDGWSTSGDSGGWVEQAMDLGNVTGTGEVWVALVFSSDLSITQPEGAYVDHVVLRKSSSPGAASVRSPAANGGKPATKSRPR
jgi:hypothetical protein